MSRTPGSPKTGGRQKGTKNKDMMGVAQILAKLPAGDGTIGFDPIKELVECYHRCANTDGVMHVAVKCLDVLIPYVHAKVTPDGGFSPADIALVQQIKELASRPRQEIIEIAQNEIKKLSGKE